MATLPNPLPKLTADPGGSSLGLELPAGRLIDTTDEGPWHEPLLWLAEDRTTLAVWASLEASCRTAGLLPVVVDVGGGHGGPGDWELMPGEMSYPGDHDAEEVLADLWEEYAAEDEEWPGPAPASAHAPTSTPAPAPAPEQFPGRPADPDTVAHDIVGSLLSSGGPLKDPRLALVPARRSADIPAVIGWSGPVNHEGDTARLSSILRSWEDRFGIRVVALGFDHLLVSVAAPPTTLAEAKALAAEHFAFCPDTIWQGGDPTLPAYAEHQLLNQPAWHFWWD